MSKTDSAADQAYRMVKELIISGELPGGELISEGEIASKIEYSRTPVREAFLRLEVEGWMRLYPKRGALVVPIADGEAEHIVDARQLVETGSVRAVAALSNVRASLVAALRASVQHQRDLTGDETAEFAAADADFHRMIVDAAGNPLLSAFYATLRERQRRMTARSLARNLSQTSQIIDDHSGLVDLIESADVDGFDRAVSAHMRTVHGLDPVGIS